MGAVIDASEHLRSLHEQLGKVLSASTAGDRGDALRKAQGVVADLDTWLTALEHRPEARALPIAFREYATSLLSASMGLYGLAFYGLRHFLEVTLGIVLLSSNELNLRRWQAGKHDLSWTSTIDDDRGVFSLSFVQAFCEPLVSAAPQTASIAKKLYRECSEFVHGNPPVTARLPPCIEFRAELLNEWLLRAESTALVVQSALAMRYLLSLSKESVLIIETSVRDTLGYHTAIREYLDHQHEV